MDIGVGGEIIVAVAKPLLDILHRIVQVQHDGGAAMSEVVEADGAQAVLYQNLLEFLAHEIRLQQHSHLVHADEVQVLPVVAGTANLHLGHLPLTQPGEIIVSVLAQRQAPAAGLGLGGAVPDGADHTVANAANRYADSLEDIRVWDDGVVKGFILVKNGEVKKLFVEPILQGQGLGAKLLEYAVEHMGANTLWALEKNTRAIRFYQRHGFHLTGERQLEDGTSEYLVRMQLTSAAE